MTPPPEPRTVEPRWEVWARHLAPLLNDGLIDTAQAGRDLPDKAFYLARLLDEHLPAGAANAPLREAIMALSVIRDEGGVLVRRASVLAALTARQGEATTPAPYDGHYSVTGKLSHSTTTTPASSERSDPAPLDVEALTEAYNRAIFNGEMPSISKISVQAIVAEYARLTARAAATEPTCGHDSIAADCPICAVYDRAAAAEPHVKKGERMVRAYDQFFRAAATEDTE